MWSFHSSNSSHSWQGRHLSWILKSNPFRQGGVDTLLYAVQELRFADLHLAESRHRFAAGAVGPELRLRGG